MLCEGMSGRGKKDEFPDFFMSVGKKERKKRFFFKARLVTKVVQPFLTKPEWFFYKAASQSHLAH